MDNYRLLLDTAENSYAKTGTRCDLGVREVSVIYSWKTLQALVPLLHTKNLKQMPLGNRS